MTSLLYSSSLFDIKVFTVLGLHQKRCVGCNVCGIFTKTFMQIIRISIKVNVQAGVLWHYRALKIKAGLLKRKLHLELYQLKVAGCYNKISTFITFEKLKTRQRWFSERVVTIAAVNLALRHTKCTLWLALVFKAYQKCKTAAEAIIITIRISTLHHSIRSDCQFNTFHIYILLLALRPTWHCPGCTPPKLLG